MHPRNPYTAKRPDFAALCLRYPGLKQYQLKKTKQKSRTAEDLETERETNWLDFTSPSKDASKEASDETVFLNFKENGAVYTLTKVLLLEDFKLHWSMPEKKNNLCPALTRSINYLLWVEDMLCILFPTVELEDVCGIDVGTGASCIFPLLACQMHKSWIFNATDIDSASLKNAQQNIARNNLSSRITTFLNKREDSVFPAGCLKEKFLMFTMCNPPFFSSQDHAEQTKIQNSSFQGTDNEIWNEDGGEVQLIKRMINESLKEDRLRANIALYTSMVGIKANLTPILDILDKIENITFVRVTTLRQGHTFRWAIAWSFLPDPAAGVSNFTDNKRKRYVFEDVETKDSTANRMKMTLKSLSQSFVSQLEFNETERRIDEFLDLRYNQQYRRTQCGNILIYASDVKDSSVSPFSRLLFMCFISLSKNIKSETVSSVAVCTTLLDEGASDRKAFVTFCHRLQADVERKNRYWRRRQKKKVFEENLSEDIKCNKKNSQ